jgi:hypothetical protein
MIALGSLSALSLTLLFGGPSVLLPARLAAVAAVAAHAHFGDASRPGVPDADDVVLLHLAVGPGLAATGRPIACREDGTWKAGEGCDVARLAGRELRVFTGLGGELARFTAGEARADGSLEKGAAVTVPGQLSAPLPAADPEDALRTPLALLGDARHLVDAPSIEGWSPEALGGVIDLGKRAGRMNRRMSQGMQPEQYAVFNLTPAHREIVAVAASTWPEGALDAAPLPTASMLVVHDPTTSDWALLPVSQVISKPTDLRRFERYRLLAVLDIDGDDHRELVVRGRSALGDRFTLFRLRDDGGFGQIAPWAGVVQAASAPTTIR